MHKYILPGVIILILLILFFSNSSDSKEDSKKGSLVVINYDVHRYDKATQKNIHEAFYNLVLLKQIMETAPANIKDVLIPPILESLSMICVKLQDILKIEELKASINEVSFRIKSDGVGNICFGSPDYFMCLNPNTKKIFPYINDKLIVYHIMLNRVTGVRFRDPEVENIVKSVLSNVIPCSDVIDLGKGDVDSIILTKLFNSSLDPKILSRLMMIVLFMSPIPLVDSLTMTEEAVFFTSDATRTFLQSFVPFELTNVISYKAMKHALFNFCFAKYTVQGFEAVEKDEKKREERKSLIDTTLSMSFCPVVPTTEQEKTTA